MKYFSSFLIFIVLFTFNLQAQYVYSEQNGLVIIEAENLPLADGWRVGSDGLGYSGRGYIYWAGKNYFEEPGNGIVEIPIEINNPGTYRIQWHHKIGEGADFTEFNDSWLKFPDASNFYGLKDGKKVFPKGTNKGTEPEGAGKEEWFKVFLTGTIDWTFSTNTSDNENYQLYAEFDQPGTYKIQLSARSSKHLIDRIVLFQENQSEKALDLNTPISDCKGVEQKPNLIHQSKRFEIIGEPQVWHKITYLVTGPKSSVLNPKNPFSDYLLEVSFKHSSGKEYKIQGFYAACGNAADNECIEGNKWKLHFVPDRAGEWMWEASFYEGKDVAIGGDGKKSKYINGSKGTLIISESNKTGNDLRSPNKGRLQYVGEHYLQFSGTNRDEPNGDWFIKAGADATENSLDYIDFANTPNRKGLTKHWGPHSGDYDVIEGKAFTWGDGKGKNILGMIKYLSDQGLNAFSFLTFSLAGDDQNVFPHQMKVTNSVYETLEPLDQWKLGVHHDRFDCAKLDQWEQVFSYADQLGMFLHFKLGEEENETLFDNGDLGRERKLYYRELIARFGHHLAINWNLGEENGYPIEPYMTDEQRIIAANYIKELDPYQNHRVIHTRPDLQDTVYNELIGSRSELTGASLQCLNNGVVHSDVFKWVTRSEEAGKKWVVTNDEQGTYKIGVAVDEKYDELGVTDNRKEVRNKVLWGTLMAGGAGVEYYYGYQTGCGDLDCQNHRTRSSKWHDASIALKFFNNHLQQYLPRLSSMDNISSDPDDYVLVIPNEVYVVYMPSGGTNKIELESGDWQMQWFNPRSNGLLSEAYKLVGNEIEAPDKGDWVAVIKKK